MTEKFINPEKTSIEQKTFALVIIAALIVTINIASNLMSVKILNIGGISIFDAGTILFPFAYMLGDVITEIWGFKTSRKIIFLTFGCTFIMVAATSFAVLLPYPEEMAESANAYAIVFGFAPRIYLASAAAFLIGELTNAALLSFIKEKTKGKHLWIRTIGSSIAGHFLDSAVFLVIAFGGIIPLGELIAMMFMLYIAKLLIEVFLGTPLAYLAVNKLRKYI